MKEVSLGCKESYNCSAKEARLPLILGRKLTHRSASQHVHCLPANFSAVSFPNLISMPPLLTSQGLLLAGKNSKELSIELSDTMAEVFHRSIL
jgi:hypothetical protein